MIFLGKNYSAIWDKDKDGKDGYNSALKSFGDYEARKWGFYSLGKRKKVILQNLFSGNDLKLIKDELELPKNSKFTKVIVSLYHSKKRVSILRKMSAETKDNFKRIENEIIERMKN